MSATMKLSVAYLAKGTINSTEDTLCDDAITAIEAVIAEAPAKSQSGLRRDMDLAFRRLCVKVAEAAPA